MLLGLEVLFALLAPPVRISAIVSGINLVEILASLAFWAEESQDVVSVM